MRTRVYRPALIRSAHPGIPNTPKETAHEEA